MALELVAGPFPLQTLDAVAVTDLVTNFQKAGYDDSVGFFAYSAAMGGICVVQLDGTVCLRGGQARANVIALDLQTKNDFLIHDSWVENGIRKLNKSSMTGDIVAIVENQATNYTEGIHVRCLDRYLKIITSRVEVRPLDFSSGWVQECPLTKTTGFVADQVVCRTRIPDILAIILSTGEILFYNHVLKQQLAKHSYIGANVGAWYSPMYDIYIALNSGDTISIYSNDVLPDTLSDAVAVTPLVRGKVSRVKVRLLGASSEPCVGERIEWSATGAQLLQEQSLTDEDGYAWNDCVVSPSSTVGAAIEITAEVQF